MALTADDIYKSLLQNNYFPAQRKTHGEIPPIFTTNELTKEIAEKIKNINGGNRKGGFDCISYTSTRFDLVPRILQIPFPKAYIDLCFCIHENWDNIKHICFGELSAIKPAKHDDGRVIIMDYEEKEEKEHWHVENSFSERFGIHADIANFYPSIYSHSIAWAAAGHEEAKRNSKDSTKWYNKLDQYQRLTTRNETKGIPIGSATSNIIAEFILQKIDTHFSVNSDFGHGISYRRYIDDYQCYAKTREKAEEFIRELRLELSKYSLLLNSRKTYMALLIFKWVRRSVD